MTWAQLVTFNVVLIVAIASPGPAMLMATQTSLSAGRAAGIAVGAGLRLVFFPTAMARYGADRYAVAFGPAVRMVGAMR